MEKSSKTENRKLSLGDDFGPAVARFSGLTFTTDGHGNVKDHTDGTVQLMAPALEQTNAPNNSSDAIASTVDVKSFSPDNSIIRAGTVQLNKISQYLADLPDTATAQLLVSPQDLANIDGGGLGTWINSIKRICDIKGYHGLDGMEIYDRPEIARGTTYEKAWADQIKAAFAQAQSSGKEVTTGLFMPTKQLVDGRNIGLDGVTVETNLYSKREDIKQIGDAFITKHGSGFAHWQFTATEYPGDCSRVYAVNFYDGIEEPDNKGDSKQSARPVALTIQP